MSVDRKTAIGIFVLSLGVLYLSINIPKTAIRQTVGPEVVPIGLSLALMISAAILYARPARAVAAGSEPAEFEHEDRLPQALVLLGVVGYMFLLEPLGFIVATAGFCIYESTVLDPRRWIRNVLASIGFSLAVYAMFVNLLEIMLPVGILGW